MIRFAEATNTALRRKSTERSGNNPMDFALILMNQVFIMFLLLAVGFFLYKIKFVSQSTTKQMTSIVLHLVTPALILNTYQMDYDTALTKNMLTGFLLSAASILIGLIISNFARIRNKKSLSIERFTVIFSNCGFMAIPLIDAVFGEIGVFYCNTYMTMFNIIVWTYGVALMNRKDPGERQTTHAASEALRKEPKSGIKKNLLSSLRPFLTPTMVCIVFGLLCYFLQIKFPSPVKTTVGYIASMNTPLAMIVSGMYIAQSDFLSAFKKLRNYYIVFLKCFLVPIAVLFAFLLLPIDDTLFTTVLIASACPSASMSVLFAGIYGKDVETASNIFTMTTLLSILSIPAVILLKSLLTGVH